MADTQNLPSADARVEKLVADIAAVIRSVEPERRGELKELAEALLRDEVLAIGEAAPSGRASTASQNSNPLLAGILLLLVGVGLFLLFPLVGGALAAIAGLLIIWGVVLSWARK